MSLLFPEVELLLPTNSQPIEVTPMMFGDGFVLSLFATVDKGTILPLKVKLPKGFEAIIKCNPLFPFLETTQTDRLLGGKEYELNFTNDGGDEIRSFSLLAYLLIQRGEAIDFTRLTEQFEHPDIKQDEKDD